MGTIEQMRADAACRAFDIGQHVVIEGLSTVFVVIGSQGTMIHAVPDFAVTFQDEVDPEQITPEMVASGRVRLARSEEII